MPHLNSHVSKERPDQRQKMLETPIPVLVGGLAVPTIISMLVTSIYNMADTYFVSQINTSASGAVGVVFSIMSIIQAVGFTVGMGSGSIASRLLGQGNKKEADTYASSAVLTALVLGLTLAAVGLLNLRELIWLLGSTSTIYPYALDYAQYILLGAPVMILSFTLNNLLRWQGKANLSVMGLATGGILNMILDPIFIFVFGMGIGGAGAATLLSQCVSLTILSSFFAFKRSDLRVSPACVARTPRVYLAILKQGMPSFFRQGVLSLSTMAVNYNARIYGDAAVASLAIVTKVFMVVNSIIIGFGQGFQPVLGYNYGAGRMDRMKEALTFSIKTCTAILTAAAILGLLFTTPIITFFRDDPLVIEIGVRALRFQCFTLPLGAIAVFSNMFFQSLGKSWRATILAVCRQGLCIPLVFLLSHLFDLSGLVATQATCDLLSFLISSIIFLQYFRGEYAAECAQSQSH
ncbi:MATE family efflux transporter [Pseudoflavonifractor phocaeensis]|uniref:MATE family efflux transporter n=1 Tax=Pseudoflavonifractor phocaeensis TaxID=1870988 RepID=UPI001F32FC8E|nr:MATE family efflux transporter [Pseudoflavonifractor phocaeensis]